MGLFRTIHQHTHHHAPDKVEIHEHKAPTDASIKLGLEMRERAIKSIGSELVLGDGNMLEGVVITLMGDGLSLQSSLHIFFRFNGREYAFTQPIPGNREQAIMSKAALIGKLAECIALQVTQELLLPVIAAMEKES